MGSVSAFWDAIEAVEAEHAAAKAEALRASREADFLARIPDAPDRVCCVLRYAVEPCDEGHCQVVAGVLG